ncbi:hypothetical protein LXL04_005042 [Taraxacum kok-saghyz]
MNKGECDIWCPCKKFQNCQKLSDLNAIEEHLLIEGFMNDYTCWSQHGELLIDHSTVDVGSNYDDVDDSQDDIRDNLDEMLDDIEGDVPDNDYEKFQQLIEDSEKPLYDGCTKFTKLSAVLKLFNLKANNGWSDKSFTEILEAINEMLPEGNELPVSLYQAKKIMCAMDLEIERIHACPNDCMLYRNEHANLHECITCGTSRYLRKKQTEYNSDVKKNAPPAKLLWYLHIIPRLKRLFANANDAKLLRWHAEERKRDGKMRHVADSPQWRNIDHEFEEFGDEIRNIRFGLSADGINAFRNMSSRHSTWPVLLCIYNLPPWLCMKRKYIMMSLLIQGPKQPGNDIDVFLAPLIEDMKKLWNSGVEVYDAYKKENFELRAMIYCTISDFPAYANLSGYSTKGKKACPVCEENTQSMWLKNCNKIVYMGHRRSLPKNHLYRTRGNLFDGKTEEEDMTPPMDGETTFSRELPYWKTLAVRHCLEVMHIEKNVCDSLICLLLNIPNKSKDGLSVREDMVAMGIRPELASIRQEGRRTYLPPACYTMSKEEKTKFCKCLHGIKVPSGYSANIKKLVSTNDLKLIGMKSHDFHVLITHMIPIAIRGILPDRVRHAITKLCLFLNMIHSKVINPEVLDSWHRDVIITLSQLEMYFPPSFFDVMVHLVSHIVREIKACSPVFQRYMYPFERHLGSLKGYVRNRHRLEGSIVRGYASEEVTDFCTNYLKGVTTIGIPQSRHEGRLQGVGTIGLKVVIPDREEFHMEHFTVLQHMTSVAPYANEHMEMLWLTNGRMFQKWLANEHIKKFPQWLKDKDGKSTLQNSGVTLIAMSTEYSSANHEGRSIIAKDSYYGHLQEIWELKYDSSVVVPVFKCKWVENQRGVKVDEDGFTLVNLSTHGYRRILGVENVVDEEEYDQFDDLPPFSIGIPSVNVDINVAAYLRSNHNEGSYVEIRLMYPAPSRNSRSHNSETHKYRPSPTSRLPFFTVPIPPAPASASVNRHSPPAPAHASTSVDFALQLQNDSRFPAQSKDNRATLGSMDVKFDFYVPESRKDIEFSQRDISESGSDVLTEKKEKQEQQMKERLEESMLNDSFYVKLKDKLITDVADKIVPVVVTTVMQHMEVRNVSTSVGSKTSKTVLDELHNITDATDCELMLPYGTVRTTLAKGTVFPFADGLIHSVPLEAGHLKVSVDLIYRNHQSFILPVSPVEEVHSLGDTLHSFIQWPRDSIRLIMKDKGPLTKPLPVSTEDAHILCDQLLEDVSVGSPQHVRQVQKRKQKQTVRKKVMPKKPQGPRDRQIQSLMLHSLMPISRMENKCAFVNPQEITSKRCEYDDKLETSFSITHLVDVMTFHKEKHFLLHHIGKCMIF